MEKQDLVAFTSNSTKIFDTESKFLRRGGIFLFTFDQTQSLKPK
jgi:hypothetical protein